MAYGLSDQKSVNNVISYGNAVFYSLIFFQTRIISLVGGTGATVVNNALKTIVGHEVSKNFNLTGTKGKQSFAAFQSINSVVKSKSSSFPLTFFIKPFFLSYMTIFQFIFVLFYVQ